MLVEVAYALADEQTLLPLEVVDNTSIKQAISQSGMLERYPQINLKTNKVGIFGKIATLETLLQEKDRVEIYRTLIADPKEVRKQRAIQGKKMRSQK